MISGHSYINCPMKVYNGNDTFWTEINPWAEEVQVYGSDNLFPSSVTKDSNITAYINNMYRFGWAAYEGTKKKQLGIEALRFTISTDNMADKSINPGNAKYY